MITISSSAQSPSDTGAQTLSIDASAKKTRPSTSNLADSVQIKTASAGFSLVQPRRRSRSSNSIVAGIRFRRLPTT